MTQKNAANLSAALDAAFGKRRPRSKSTIKVSPATEWTGHDGMNELFGLRRTMTYHLCATEPMLKDASISLKGPNEVRGKRLFNVAKFRVFFASKQLAQQPKTKNASIRTGTRQ